MLIRVLCGLLSFFHEATFRGHLLGFDTTVKNIISFFSSRKKKREYLPLYVFEKTRVSCYKLCKENKSFKLQMLALRKIKLSRLLVQRINEYKINEIKCNTKMSRHGNP